MTSRKDEELLARCQAGLKAWIECDASASAGARTLRIGPATCAIVPVSPERSIINSVSYEQGEGAALIDAHDEIAAAYAEAGVNAWLVWVNPGDRETAEALAARGHKLDGKPVAMGAPLAALDLGAPPPRSSLRFAPAVVGEINERAYKLAPNEFSGVFSELGEDAPIRFYLAEADGAAVACVGMIDLAGDAGVYWVATDPAFRGRGLCKSLMREALHDSRAAGCTTTTLQASPKGLPIYRKLGYRELGEFELWERRV